MKIVGQFDMIRKRAQQAQEYAISVFATSLLDLLLEKFVKK